MLKRKEHRNCWLISSACIGVSREGLYCKQLHSFLLGLLLQLSPDTSHPRCTPSHPQFPGRFLVSWTYFMSWTYIFKAASNLEIPSRLANPQGIPLEVTDGFWSPSLLWGSANSLQLLATEGTPAAAASGSLPRKHVGSLLCSFSPLSAL